MAGAGYFSIHTNSSSTKLNIFFMILQVLCLKTLAIFAYILREKIQCTDNVDFIVSVVNNIRERRIYIVL